MNINCENFEDYVMRYIDGTLTAEELASLNRHTAECDKCAEELAAYRDMLSEVSAVPEPTPAADFTDNVLKAVSVCRQPNKKLAFLVVCSIISSVSSVAGFLKLLLLNRTQVVTALSDNGLLSPLGKAVNFLANADIAFTAVLKNVLLSIDYYRDTLMLCFLIVGAIIFGVITSLRKSALGGIK
jgi:anti-sigma factor RsiW